MESLSNKLKMRGKNTQFVNNTPQITNCNAVPSKNIVTLELHRISLLMRMMVIMVILRIIIIINYFYQIIH
jgi:hypothetical protein